MSTSPNRSPSEDVAVIEDAFNQYKVLLFRRQPMSAAQLRDFSAHFGALQEHVQRKYQHPDVPEVVCMTNRKPDGTFDEVGASRGAAPDIRDGWHSDLSFEKEPAKATLLHAVEIPECWWQHVFLEHDQGLRSIRRDDEATPQRPRGGIPLRSGQAQQDGGKGGGRPPRQGQNRDGRDPSGHRQARCDRSAGHLPQSVHHLQDLRAARGCKAKN